MGFDEARTKQKAFSALLDGSAVNSQVDTLRAKQLSVRVRTECCFVAGLRQKRGGRDGDFWRIYLHH